MIDAKQAAEFMTGLTAEELVKAVKDAKGLEGIRIIKDLWEDYWAMPERNDTKTGPTMHSSGAGADKAMHEYSNPAPQVGITEQYAEFTQKNIEGWGKMHEAFKSLGDEIKAGFGALLKKAEDMEKKEEKKDDKKEEMKAEPEKEKDMECKSMSDKVASLWDALGEVEAAYAKAEEHHDEKKDIAGLDSAKEHIEKAEKELEKVEEHEKEEQAHQQAMKADVYINLAWKAIAKATGLNSYDLKGYGNQSDDAVTGDSTADQSKKDLKKATAKAKYYALKAADLRKSLGMPKDETLMTATAAPVAAATAEPAPAAAAEPAATADPKPEAKAADVDVKAEIEAAKADLQKSFNERIEFLNKRMEQTTGSKMPPMVPVLLKGGIKSDEVVTSINSKIEVAEEAGELTSEDAAMARSLVQRYAAAGRGHVSPSVVDQQVERATLPVQNFFHTLTATV